MPNAVRYEVLSERLEDFAGLKLTAEEFAHFFPEIDYEYVGKRLHGTFPFIVKEDRIYGIFENVEVVTLVDFR
jgi:hypothetical protein